MTTRNEAAERLRRRISPVLSDRRDDFHRLLDEALAAERRATVERIRERFYDKGWTLTGSGMEGDVRAILDEEAAR
jgi:hypothetical protein